MFDNFRDQLCIVALVSTVYAHNPSAVHNRLQDMFDKFSELAERDQQEVAKLLQYVGQKHPEVYNVFFFCLKLLLE